MSLDSMYANFEVRGQIVKTRTHTQKGQNGKTFGFISVATGTSVIDFYVDDVNRLHSGELDEGVEVMVAGSIKVVEVKDAKGYNAQGYKLYADAIMTEPKASAKPAASSASK